MTDHSAGLNGAVAAELRAEMARQGVTQKELARTSGVPVVSVQRYLAHTRAIDISSLDKLARALGTDAMTVMATAGSRLRGE